ncbi:MAG TPA: hypothetical protein VGI81_26480 [Tepidisphaeraceae bacterium]
MKWSKLIGLLVLALGIGTLCSSGAESAGLRNIRNVMDLWPRESLVAIDVFAVLLVVLSGFLYRGRNWARLVLLGGCVCYCILAVVGAVVLGLLVSNIVDVVYVAGILIWSIAGPLFLIFVLRQPAVVKEYSK